jgi:hypothetical protein
MSAISKLLSIAAMAEAMTSYSPVRRKEFVKSPLSKKAKKVRAKNKIAKQSRKSNRKK